MSVFRLVVSLLVSASALAAGAVHLSSRDAPAFASVTLLPDLAPPKAPARGEIVLSRLNQRLTAEMRTHFDLFLYVSKSASGPLAQRMYVFRKQPEGLQLAHEWSASTGREKVEVNARGRSVITATPIGYYQLDPRRMYPRYRSASWDQDMPNAMFFDWERAGSQTGLAIHAAVQADIAKLGGRASGGCVHLAPGNAAALFDLVQENYRGTVPRFAYDHETRTASNRGDFMRDPTGALRMTHGYRVLVMVEDYGGGDAVAALF
jgi:hypothetical protein